MNKFKKGILVICFLVTSISCFSQQWQWGRRGGGPATPFNQSEKIKDMVTDAKGNVYILANLNDANAASIDNGNGDSTLTSGWGGQDVLFAKYSNCGKLIWHKIIGGTITDNAFGMCMDSFGHVNVLFGVGGQYLNIDTDTAIYFGNNKVKYSSVVQYDTAGKYKWYRSFVPDTVPFQRANQYSCFNIDCLPNGDIYLFCYFGKGLLGLPGNIVVNTPGYYMLKLNVKGIPQQLIPLDMRSTGVPYNACNFRVTKSRKFIFNINRSTGTSTDSLFVAGQFVDKYLNVFCFSASGGKLWHIKNNRTNSGALEAKPLIDELKGKIFLAGGGNTTPDIIGNFQIANSNGTGNMLFVFCADTMGNIQWIKKPERTLNPMVAMIQDFTINKQGKLFSTGFGGGILWDGHNFINDKFIGYHTFLVEFDTTTKLATRLDSLMGCCTYTTGDKIATDTFGNVFVGGSFSGDISIAGKTLQSDGGVTDFYLAKWGVNSCGLVPLKFTMYDVRCTNGNVISTKEKSIENVWQTANEVNVHYFNVQRSLNGRDWVNVGYVLAKNKGSNEYSFLDVNREALVGRELYYRIESVDVDGQKQYSEIRKLALTDKRESVVVYPNPARGVVNVYCKDGIKEVRVFNSIGQQISQQELRNDGVQSTVDCRQSTVRLNISGISRGMYILQIVTTKGLVKNEKIVVE